MAEPLSAEALQALLTLPPEQLQPVLDRLGLRSGGDKGSGTWDVGSVDWRGRGSAPAEVAFEAEALPEMRWRQASVMPRQLPASRNPYLGPGVEPSTYFQYDPSDTRISPPADWGSPVVPLASDQRPAARHVPTEFLLALLGKR